MARKTFKVSVGNGGVAPTTHRVRVGDEIEWTLDKGSAVVVFEPDGAGPVLFTRGPKIDPQVAALATAGRADSHPFFVCCWYEQGGRKEHESLQAVLIIDP